MIAGQKSVRNGIEDFLCPFTDMYISQGSNGQYSHQGTMANDVCGASGGRDAYYAPCTIRCISVYSPYGESRWQSVNPVRFSNGRIDYATFEIAHDNSQNCYVGQIVEQGVQLGNMGNMPADVCTGIHCHIQISQSNDSTYYRNAYGNLIFNNEYDTDDCYFMDGTNILNCEFANWKYLKDVPVNEPIDIEKIKKENEQLKAQINILNEKIIDEDSQILELKKELSDYTKIYECKKEGMYKIKLYNNEILYIKKGNN